MPFHMAVSYFIHFYRRCANDLIADTSAVIDT